MRIQNIKYNNYPVALEKSSPELHFKSRRKLILKSFQSLVEQFFNGFVILKYNFHNFKTKLLVI